MVTPQVRANVRGILVGLVFYAAGFALVWLFLVTLGVS